MFCISVNFVLYICLTSPCVMDVAIDMRLIIVLFASYCKVQFKLFLWYPMKMSHHKHVIYVLTLDVSIIVLSFMYRVCAPALKPLNQIKCMLIALLFFIIPAKLTYAFDGIFTTIYI